MSVSSRLTWEISISLILSHLILSHLRDLHFFHCFILSHLISSLERFQFLSFYLISSYLTWEIPISLILSSHHISLERSPYLSFYHMASHSRDLHFSHFFSSHLISSHLYLNEEIDTFKYTPSLRYAVLFAYYSERKWLDSRTIKNFAEVFEIDTTYWQNFKTLFDCFEDGRSADLLQNAQTIRP